MQSVQVSIDYPAKLSRGILLLKTFLGLLICIPHFICLWVLTVVAGLVYLISWFAVLFTGKFPKALFDFCVDVQDWGLRVWAYLGFLRDEYPTFGLKANYPASFKVTYPAKLSRWLLIARLLFSLIYVGIPHAFCLFFRFIAYAVINFIAWWAILFTGKMPAGMFSFISGTFRWIMNVAAYLNFMTDEYPPFSGKSGDGIQVGVSAGA